MIPKKIEYASLENHIEHLFIFQIQGGSSGILSQLILFSAQRQSELMSTFSIHSREAHEETLMNLPFLINADYMQEKIICCFAWNPV